MPDVLLLRYRRQHHGPRADQRCPAMTSVLVAVLVLPLLTPAMLGLPGSRPSWFVARFATAASAAALGCAAALTISVWVRGPVSAVVGHGSNAVAGWYADRLSTALLLLITAVATVVHGFAGRYLNGDSRSSWFYGTSSLLTAAAGATVCSSTLIGLATAWTLTGVALCGVLATYSQLAAARQGVVRTAISFAIGDSALWVAVIVASVNWGNLDLRRLPAAVPRLTADPFAVDVVACLLVVAALARCAQIPFHQWLPATLSAPTPASALLHAGVVNAGGFLLARLSPIFGASEVATHLALLAGALTLGYATVLMLTKADIKGALAYSTMAQMGFMLTVCALGAFAAAIFHLIAHGAYKATLFLGSGAAVDRRNRHRHGVPPPEIAAFRRITLAVAAAIAAAASVTVAALLNPPGGGVVSTWPLLIFAAAAAGRGLYGWFHYNATAGGVVSGIAATAGIAFAYVTVADRAAHWLSVGLWPAHAALSPWWLVAVAVVLAVTALLPAIPPAANATRRLYVAALSAGYVPARRLPFHRFPAGGTTTLLPVPAGIREVA